MQRGRLNVLLGGQHGSEGKGKMVAYIARKHRVDLAIANHGSNAGHSFYIGNKKYVAFHLPASAAYPGAKLCLGPSSLITLTMFYKELEDFADLNVKERLSIHPLATIITDSCVGWEKMNLVRISSTTKGCGRALAMKVMRHPDALAARDVPALKPFLADTNAIVHEALNSHKLVLAESAQGFDLSLNYGKIYPYVTSRAVDVGQTLSDCGVPPRLCGTVYGCIRCHPIRVGNVYDKGIMIGYSGPFYSDQKELTWDNVTQQSGSKEPIMEYTTVTGKVRRVFSWSDEQAAKFMRVCDPNFLCLNFVNYLDASIKDSPDARVVMESSVVHEFVRHVNRYAAVAYLGTGAGESAMVDLGLDAVI